MLVHCKINESAFKKVSRCTTLLSASYLNFLAKIFWPFLKEKNHKLIKINCLEIDFNESELTIAAHLLPCIGSLTEAHLVLKHILFKLSEHIWSYQIMQIQVKLEKPSCLWVSCIKTF